MSYELKYKKYKNKYLELKNIQHGGISATLYIKTKECEYTFGVDSDIFSQITTLKDNDSLEIKFTFFNLYINQLKSERSMIEFLNRFTDYTGKPIKLRLIITKQSQPTDQYSVEIHYKQPENMLNVDLTDFDDVISFISEDLTSTLFTFNINTMGAHTHG